MRRPVSPLGGWKGGKFRLAAQIVAKFPPHHCYCEPFCGAAHVFFRKTRAKCEILNDINFDVINFFEVCRDRPQELIARFKYAVASRKLFETYRDEPAPKDPVERAFRFVYILKLCFGGRLTGKSSFDQSKVDPASVVALDKTPEKIGGATLADKIADFIEAKQREAGAPEKIGSGYCGSNFNKSIIDDLPKKIIGENTHYLIGKHNRAPNGLESHYVKDAHERMAENTAHARLAEFCDQIHGRYKRVSLECGPWQKMLERYDSPGTLFYLDPPYEGKVVYPGDNLFIAERDLPELAEKLAKIKGKFALSINDGEAPRALFSGYNFFELMASYSSHNLKTKARVQKRELLITNYEPPQGELTEE